MERSIGITRVTSLLAAIACVLSACGQDDLKWEIGREARGGLDAYHERTAEEWGIYRDQVVRSLDSMQSALESAKREGTVFDRKEIDELLDRTATLRGEFTQPADASLEEVIASRNRLRESLRSVRSDVEAVLTRLGHNPDQIARWRDAS